MECAFPPLMPVIVLIVLLPDRKVIVRQGADDGTTTTSPTTTGVVSNQLLCQLDPEGLDDGELRGDGVVLRQD